MPPATGGRSILVADDDPGMCRFIKECLKRSGISTTEAHDGVTACEQAEAAPPDLVLLDIILPKRDGYSVLLHLRSAEATRNIPVILMSGEADGEQSTVAKSLGAQAFLAKPFTAANLQSAVEAALKGEAR